MQYRIYQIDQQIPNYRRTKFLIPDICPNCGKINNPQSSIEGHTHYSGFKIIYMRHHYLEILFELTNGLFDN